MIVIYIIASSLRSMKWTHKSYCKLTILFPNLTLTTTKHYSLQNKALPHTQTHMDTHKQLKKRELNDYNFTPNRSIESAPYSPIHMIEHSLIGNAMQAGTLLLLSKCMT